MTGTPLTAKRSPQEQADYSRGYSDGIDNKGYWGDETEAWSEGFADGTEERIHREIADAEDD